MPKSTHDGHGTKMEINYITFASLLQNNLSKKIHIALNFALKGKKDIPNLVHFHSDFISLWGELYITLMSVLLGGNGKDRKVYLESAVLAVWRVAVEEGDVDPLIAFDDAYCVDFLLKKTWWKIDLQEEPNVTQ